MSKNLVTILLLTLITLSAWIGFQIFRIATSSTIPESTQEQLEGLDPNLDQNVLDDLKESL